MKLFAEEQLEITKRLGKRLKNMRKQNKDTQAVFAERMGISRLTYIKMEQGNPAIPVGNWITASILLNREQDWDVVFEQKSSLFDQLEVSSLHTNKPPRKKKP